VDSQATSGYTTSEPNTPEKEANRANRNRTTGGSKKASQAAAGRVTNADRGRDTDTSLNMSLLESAVAANADSPPPKKPSGSGNADKPSLPSSSNVSSNNLTPERGPEELWDRKSSSVATVGSDTMRDAERGLMESLKELARQGREKEETVELLILVCYRYSIGQVFHTNSLC